MDMTDYCLDEHWLTMFALILGLLFQSAVISKISSTLVEMSMLRQKHREEMRIVSTYMKKKKLPPDLRDKISTYYERSYKENLGVDEGAILNKVAVTLKNEIMQFNAKELLKVVPLFKNSPSEVFTAFAQELHSETLVQGTFVLNEGEPAAVSGGVYFIRSGCAEILAQRGADDHEPDAKATGENATVVALIGDGCYFGDVAVVFGKKRTASVRARTMLICYSLDSDGWEQLIQNYDYLRAYVTLIARRRDERAKILSKIAADAKKTGDTRALPAAQREYVDEEDSLTEFVRSRLVQDERRRSQDEPPETRGSNRVYSGGLEAELKDEEKSR